MLFSFFLRSLIFSIL
jgi:hypothetical protein